MSQQILKKKKSKGSTCTEYIFNFTDFCFFAKTQDAVCLQPRLQILKKKNQKVAALQIVV